MKPPPSLHTIHAAAPMSGFLGVRREGGGPAKAIVEAIKIGKDGEEEEEEEKEKEDGFPRFDGRTDREGGGRWLLRRETTFFFSLLFKKVDEGGRGGLHRRRGREEGSGRELSICPSLPLPPLPLPVFPSI